MRGEDKPSPFPLGSRASIRLRRVYDPVGPNEGIYFLVDRLWPRGLKKDDLRLTGWLKQVAPSEALRRWFSHDPAKWKEFQQRYFTELDGKPQSWRPILEVMQQRKVTLLYSARDREHNNALALKAYLEKRLKDQS